jgi:hypothetical protein
MNVSTWMHWQTEIVAIIRRDYQDLLPQVQWEDIDWEAWKPLYEQGCTASIAVSTALSSTAETLTVEGRGDRAA